jgi:hypothetical protein
MVANEHLHHGICASDSKTMCIYDVISVKTPAKIARPSSPATENEFDG